MDERTIVLLVLAAALIWPVVAFVWKHIVMRAVRFAVIAVILAIAVYAILLIAGGENPGGRAGQIEAGIKERADRMASEIAPEGLRQGRDFMDQAADRSSLWQDVMSIYRTLTGDDEKARGSEKEAE